LFQTTGVCGGQNEGKGEKFRITWLAIDAGELRNDSAVDSAVFVECITVLLFEFVSEK
jgi:hypothetical protein